MVDKQYQPGDLKQDPDTKSVAIKTAPNVTVGDWFVFNPIHGGDYVSGREVDTVVEWPDLKPAVQKGAPETEEGEL